MSRSSRVPPWLSKVVLLSSAALSLLAGPTLYAQRQTESGLVPTLVTFRNTPGAGEQSVLTSLGGKIKYVYDLAPTIAAWLPGDAVSALSVNPGVLRVEPDVRVHTFDAELTNSWGADHIGADLAHASGNKGAGVKVGIIDSGIDYTHPDLTANYAGGWDFVNHDADPRDDYGHGTHVAGIIGAADNGLGIIGVAPEADLYAYKVFDSSGQGNYSDVIAALEQALSDGVDVVNLSLGSESDPGQAFRDACNNAAAAGLLLVASAGNFGNPGGVGDTVAYPGQYPSVITVGATMDAADQRAYFSGTGPDLDLMAPGYEVYTTDLYGGYSYETGTSMAAPFVTATAALFIRQGVGDVQNALISTAIDLGPAGFDPLYGHGLVNAAAAAVPAPSAFGLAMVGLWVIRRRRAINT